MGGSGWVWVGFWVFFVKKGGGGGGGGGDEAGKKQREDLGDKMKRG